MPDTYAIDLYFGDGYTDHDVIYDAVTFEVVAADVFGSGKLPGPECGSMYLARHVDPHAGRTPATVEGGMMRLRRRSSSSSNRKARCARRGACCRIC